MDLFLSRGRFHAQITIPKSGENDAKRFNCEVLGLIEIEKPDNRKMKGSFWVQVGNAQVHVSIEEVFDRNKTKAHLAYRVDNLDTWCQKFKSNNIEITKSDPFPNTEAFKFRDPFGNRVEIIERR